MSDEGQLIAGRYRLIERIGQGGMGTVLRAHDELLARPVAVKRVHVQATSSSDEVATLCERARREARSAARITHPNVIVVHDVVHDEGQPCIVMEYVPGSTLGELLQEGRTVSPGNAARIGLGIVAALRAAHAAGVVHRDVKPGNVLLGAGGRVVLTDFGIALTAGTPALTKTGEIVGSIGYMAPERIRGEQPKPASDLWALGATLYQAVEGRLPFGRDTAVETAYATTIDPLEPMKHAGPLKPLIEALLVKNPDERPSAEQVERALEEARARETAAILASDFMSESADKLGESSVRQLGQAPNRAGRRSPDKRWVRTSAVAVTTAVAMGAALYATPHRGSDASAAPRSRHAIVVSSAPSPLPKGYRLVRDPRLAVSFPVPDSWTAHQRNAEEVTYSDPTGQAGINVAIAGPAGPNPVTHFTDLEANTKINYPTYRRLRMQKTIFRAQPAAVWEFTFKGRARLFRAIDFGYGRQGGREYDIYLSAPAAEWATYRPVFDHLRDGFTTAISEARRRQ